MKTPELPTPAQRRWQPLRIGLTELFRYDCEEFWFSDGHLMLRGNNGTGKSKVLSLTLPFLLDANLSSARVEPDGDRNKRMEWNLLMGDRHERRIGYTWLELGRRDEDGTEHFITLGCGLRAIAGRSGVEAWYFLTGQRIRGELWLMSRERVPLTRERLIEAIGTQGQVFQSARDYKRAVDERLFRLGEERYAALVNTLIQLRQPQLSKNPDEQRLSAALSEALTPLDRDALEVVADSMTQLEQQEQQLKQLEEMGRAVSTFGRRYRQYARIASRRRARTVRQAQTQFDLTSGELNESQAKLGHASEKASHWQDKTQALYAQVGADQQRITVLESHPTMQDARRIDDAAQHQRSCEGHHERAAERARRAQHQQAEEARRLTDAKDEAEGTRRRLNEAAGQTRSSAHEAGIEQVAAATLEAAGFPDVLGEPTLADTLQGQMRAAERRRREQITVLRGRLHEVRQADQHCQSARAERTRRADAFEDAREASARALAVLKDAGTDLTRSWRGHLDALQILHVPEAENLLGELDLWVETLAGPNPLRSALERAWTSEEGRLATQSASIDTRRRELHTELLGLESEQTALKSGVSPVPPVPHTRVAADRALRPGAPLWQLVDFNPKVTPHERAGLEAALEAAGLLDAWVLPDGTLLDKDSQDVLLVPRAPQADSLAAWLVATLPADGVFTPGTVQRLLSSIACSPEDPQEAESWVSPSGDFRAGPARGRWRKDTAQYIGHAAREAARRARLKEIESRLAEIATSLAQCDADSALLEATRTQARAEHATAPTEDALRAAHATRNAAEEQRRRAQVALGEADARLAEAERLLSAARQCLERDALSLKLPANERDLERIEQAVLEYRANGQEMCARLREHQRMLRHLLEQEGREARAREEAQEATTQQLECRRELAEATQNVEVLRQSVGKAVEELLDDLAEARTDKQQHERQYQEAQQSLIEAKTAHSTAEAHCDHLKERLAERIDTRRQGIEGLQSFASHTGFLSVAVPELVLPELTTAWGVEAALGAARRVESALVEVAAEDADWSRIQNDINRDLQQLQTSLSTQAHRANADLTDHGLVVSIIYHERAERPDVLEQLLEEEIQTRRLALTAQERAILEGHLQSEIAVHLQNRIVETEQRVRLINTELAKRPTSTGVRYRLDWQPLPEESEGAVAGLAEARQRLLKTHSDAWSAEDRRQVGEFLRQRIQAERARDDQSTLVESLTRALDYRRWHQFRVQRQQDRQWKPLSGPASSGERALGLTVPLFAAASSHYWSADEHAPRLVLLDEAFAGIDDEARANCMALIREFDLDFVMTSEREWGCYAELPGLAICQLSRREGMDAVLVTRWTWDGRERRRQPELEERFPRAEADDDASGVMELDLT